MDTPTPRRRRRHPARGARQNTAVFSVAAFVGLGAGLAVQHSVAGTAVPTTSAEATTVPIMTLPATTVPITAAQEFDDNAPTTSTPTVATPPPTAAAPQPAPAPQQPHAKSSGS